MLLSNTSMEFRIYDAFRFRTVLTGSDSEEVKLVKA
jgi:hypothetical protein